MIKFYPKILPNQQKRNLGYQKNHWVSVIRVFNHGTKTYTYRKAKIGQVQIHWKSFERITLAISKEVLDKRARVFSGLRSSRPLGEDINVQCRPDQWLMSS